MFRIALLTVVVACGWAWPLTQEELAQYVARQQTGAVGGPRRQSYVLQAQPRQVYQQQAASHQEDPQAQGQTQYVYQPQHYTVAGAAPAHQPQQPQYVQKRPALRPVPVKGGQPLEPEDYDPNPQYQFAFDIKDDEFTNYQQRKEQREGDKISGSYSVVDSDGYIRTVTYTADPLEGFKADVVRQPTDIKVKIPQHQPLVPQEYAQYSPNPNLVARKHQTQQYLQGSTAAQVRPQYVVRPEHSQAYAGSQAQHVKYVSQPLVAAAKPVKASAIGYAQQPTASPILYQAYQQ